MQTVREEHSADTRSEIPGIVQSLCTTRLLTPTFPTALLRRLRLSSAFELGQRGHAGQWWAGLGTGRRSGYLLSDLGQAALSATGSTCPPPPRRNQPLISSHWRRSDGYDLAFNTYLPQKEAVKAANYSPDSVSPHIFCLIGEKIWIQGEPVFISQCSVLLPQAPNIARDQAGIWKISILVLHSDVKTVLWSDSDTSGINNLGQIISDSNQEQDYTKEGVGLPYMIRCERIHRNVLLETWDGALQSTWNSTINMNPFLLFTLSPVTCCLLKCA